ncbi:unnamed protein product [Notodromas monacha]|uniref:Uncharacterized protein n=1 Tax=Notodromas monacha TaxID=399045 RepID=A0A7R9GDT3_9CRUS|nr:unnamed protein product [Notodromas monacha]CAG0917210.1 unnamed protein product [Notodromas monacha]
MGIGGGFVMTIWHNVTRTAHTLIAREWAPLHASENMYGGNGTLSKSGGLAVAVPGEIAGYWEAHQKFGKLPWHRLFQPAIKMCLEGIEIHKPLGDALKSKRKEIQDESSLREIFWNNATNDVFKTGDKIRRPILAATLKRIAKHGVHEFYAGETAKKLIQDIQALGGILTLDDLTAYRAHWVPACSASLGSLDLHTSPAPTSGPLLAYILAIMETYKTDPAPRNPNPFSTWSTAEKTLVAQRVLEAFKHAYGKRTLMGDPEFLQDNEEFQQMLKNVCCKNFVRITRDKICDDKTFNDHGYYGAHVYSPDDDGTAHVSVVSENGDAVSVTSSINLYFGAKIRSVQTGIILNDEMDDFSAPNITNAFGIPPSPNNFIKPKKRPLSSMCPSVFVDRKSQKVQLVTGAAGGTRITSAVVWVSLLNLKFHETLGNATAAPRLHHQLFPMSAMTEKDFPEVKT